MFTIEVRAFGKLQTLFEERGWPIPLYHEAETPLSVEELRQQLKIPQEHVEAAFVNRLIKPLSTLLQDKDRVAFVPPGVPTIHRFNLGFYEAKE